MGKRLGIPPRGISDSSCRGFSSDRCNGFVGDESLKYAKVQSGLWFLSRVPVLVPQKVRSYMRRRSNKPRSMHGYAYASAHGILHPRNICGSTLAALPSVLWLRPVKIDDGLIVHL